jgi:hypothetical protein
VIRRGFQPLELRNLTIAKADGSNGVHYTIEASSRFEALLLTRNESAEK